MRSPFSGLPHDAAAGSAALGSRIGPLLEALEAGRLALPTLERDRALRFVERVRSLARVIDTMTDDDARAGIVSAFAITQDGPESAERAAAEHPCDLSPLAFQEARPADPGAGVRPRQQHFSASALNTFAECPRKWYYRYVCAAVEDPGSSASFYGTAFHLALEHFHEVFPRPSEAEEGAMRDRIREDVAAAFEVHRNDFDTPLEVELQLRRAQRTAQRYVDWLIAQGRKAPFTVFGREAAANLELGGHPFVGFIDRLDRDDRTGNVTIVDYKTGSIATSASEYLEKVRTFRDFQLPFYYWARTDQGDRVTRLALLPLKDALLEVEPVVLEVVPVPTGQARRSDAPVGTIGIDLLERARTRMIEICDELTSGKIDTFEVATDPSACTYCAYLMSCAKRPLPEREKFGR